GLFPEGGAGVEGPVEALVAAPGVVDQDVEASLLRPDAGEQGLDLAVVGVVAAHGDAGPAAGRDALGRLLDRPRGAVGRRPVARAAAGDVDGGPGLAQDQGDGPAGAAAGSGDDGHPPAQGRGRPRSPLKLDVHGVILLVVWPGG